MHPAIHNHRYNKYIDSVCKGLITPEKLPPTERAAYFHGLRGRYQVMLWSLVDNFEISPVDWGWKERAGVLTPIMTDKDMHQKD